MKRIILITITLCSFFIKANGQDENYPRFTFGSEWGYIGVFYSGYHYNFFAPEGFRVDPRGYEFRYSSNAEGYVHAGYNLNSRLNLSLYMGFSAIEEYHFTIPVSLRLTRCFDRDYTKDKWLMFIDIGSGISLQEHPQEILTGKIGAGYRFSLSRRTKLDFLMGLRSTYTRPDIYYNGAHISHDKVNRNNAYISAFSIGIAITL